MVNANVMMPVVLLILIFMSFPLILQFAIRAKIKGKHLCCIIEKGRPLSIKLLKIYKDDFVKDKEDEWVLKTDLMKPVDYPIGWPGMLSSFQQRVWCSLVMRGRSDPLNWQNPPAGALSSKELPAVLDPQWLINLVKGVGEEGKAGKGERMLMYIAVGASVVAVVMMFYVISKLGTIEQAIMALKAVIR